MGGADIEKCSDYNEHIYYHYVNVYINGPDWHHSTIVYKLKNGTKKSICGINGIYLGYRTLSIYTTKNELCVLTDDIKYIKFTSYDANGAVLGSTTYSNTPADFLWLDRNERTNDMNGIFEMFYSQVKFRDEYRPCNCKIKMIGCKQLHLKHIEDVDIVNGCLIIVAKNERFSFAIKYIEELVVMGMLATLDDNGEEIVGEEINSTITYEMPFDVRQRAIDDELLQYLKNNNWFLQKKDLTLFWVDAHKGSEREEIGKFKTVEELAECILEFLTRIKYNYPYFRFTEAEERIVIDFGSYSQTYVVTGHNMEFAVFCRKFNKARKKFEGAIEEAACGDEEE